MIETPIQEESRPDGLNILAGLLQEIKSLKEMVHAHEERLNNLSLNIPDTTLNAIIARTLNMHAQVLMAATRPQPVPQEAEQETDTPEEAKTQEES
jgi:hypothetical protein